jgi:hypothetical protein
MSLALAFTTVGIMGTLVRVLLGRSRRKNTLHFSNNPAVVAVSRPDGNSSSESLQTLVETRSGSFIYGALVSPLKKQAAQVPQPALRIFPCLVALQRPFAGSSALFLGSPLGARNRIKSVLIISWLFYRHCIVCSATSQSMIDFNTTENCCVSPTAAQCTTVIPVLVLGTDPCNMQWFRLCRCFRYR